MIKTASVEAAGPDCDAGYLWPGEIPLIVSLLRSVNPSRMVEVGTHTGRTAAHILRHVPSITDYVGIDVERGYVTPVEMQRGEVPANPGEMALGNPKFRLIIRPRGSYDITADELGQIDAMFIDGDHSLPGVRNDTDLADKCVRSGGIIVWHDYYPGCRVLGVSEYLDERSAHRNLHRVGTCTVFERVP